MLNSLYNQIKESEFEDLFQPISQEELEVRQKDRVDRVLKESRCTLNPDGTYSCEGAVDFSDMGLTKLPVKFNVVKGDFNCNDNNLTSLEGCPNTVGDNFDCSFNDELQTLVGGPDLVKEDYDCSFTSITTLEGGPESVGDIYNCRDTELNSFVEAPEFIGSYLYIASTPIGCRLRRTKISKVSTSQRYIEKEKHV